MMGDRIPGRRGPLTEFSFLQILLLDDASTFAFPVQR